MDKTHEYTSILSRTKKSNHARKLLLRLLSPLLWHFHHTKELGRQNSDYVNIDEPKMLIFYNKRVQAQWPNWICETKEASSRNKAWFRAARQATHQETVERTGWPAISDIISAQSRGLWERVEHSGSQPGPLLIVPPDEKACLWSHDMHQLQQHRPTDQTRQFPSKCISLAGKHGGRHNKSFVGSFMSVGEGY